MVCLLQGFIFNFLSPRAPVPSAPRPAGRSHEGVQAARTAADTHEGHRERSASVPETFPIFSGSQPFNRCSGRSPNPGGSLKKPSGLTDVLFAPMEKHFRFTRALPGSRKVLPARGLGVERGGFGLWPCTSRAQLTSATLRCPHPGLRAEHRAGVVLLL